LAQNPKRLSTLWGTSQHVYAPSDVQQGGNNLARSNYSFQKRQKELARMKKKEEKRKRKFEKNNPPEEETPEQEQTE
jgi:hypothetical protein